MACEAFKKRGRRVKSYPPVKKRTKGKTTFASFIIAVILLIGSTALAQRILTGNKLAECWRAYQKYEESNKISVDERQMAATYIGYIMGVCDATLDSHKKPSGITIRQLCSVVGKFLNEHPEKWNETAFILVINALNEAYPTGQDR